jgi:hypothetical protein
MGQGASSAHQLERWWNSQSSLVRAAIWALGIFAFLGLLLAILAFTRPTTTTGGPGTAAGASSPAQMTFSYSSAVTPSAAYQGDVARSPKPIFRSVANIVDVQYSYEGPSGNVSLAANLTAPSGWTWSVPLKDSAAIAPGSNTGTVSLDLNSLGALANDGQQAAGVKVDTTQVAVTAAVTTPTGIYSPSLELTLSPTTLALANGEESLIDTESPGTAAAGEATANTVSIFGLELNVGTARFVAVFLLVVGGLGIALLYRTMPKPDPLDEGQESRVKYRDLVLEVDPMPSPSGTVVDVPSIAYLAKLAKQYSLLILTGTDERGDVFVVQDEFLAYQYRVAKPSPAAPGTEESSEQEPDGPLSIW